MNKSKKNLQLTILSLSIITVMAGAAVAPALDQIRRNFADTSPLLIQMILTVPGLFIMLTNLSFTRISARFKTKAIAISGLILYLVGGLMGGCVNNIYLLLFFRMILGIGTGLIMPLSTGLIAYYFDSSEGRRLMGYSIAANNLGAMIAMVIVGFLSAIDWHLSFGVYLLGLIVFVFVMVFLPNEKVCAPKGEGIKSILIEKMPFIILIFLVNVGFYIHIANFSIISIKEGIVNPENVGMVMSIHSVGALLSALLFEKIYQRIEDRTGYIGVVGYIVSFILFLYGENLGVFIVGLFCNGIGFAMLMAWVNSKAVHNIPKNSTTGIMSIMSVGMYFGQFCSPLIVNFIISLFKIEYVRFPYLMGMGVSLIILLIQVFLQAKRRSEVRILEFSNS